MAKIKAPKGATAAGVGNRRDRLASFEAARKNEQRRRTFGLLALCLLLATLLLAYPVYLFVQDARARGASLDQIGASLDQAGCDPAAEEPATGNLQHVPAGTKVTYTRFPPDSGQHYDAPAPFTKRFYGVEDRPAVETLVHNLEHGYLVAWYRPDMPAEQVDQLEQVARTFADDTDPANKFIAAPWQDSDGGPFPAGKNVVLTRWTANPQAPADVAQQRGVRMGCAAVSGAAVQKMLTDFPLASSPEPNGA